MKSYTESKGEKPFDWNAFLKKESYTVDEVRHARWLANGWVTCACGNQCDVIPRGTNGRPFDIYLCELGLIFNNLIDGLENLVISGLPFSVVQKCAKKILADIEKRSAEIIAEINQNALQK